MSVAAKNGIMFYSFPIFCRNPPENNINITKKAIITTYYVNTAIGAVEGEFYISFKNSPSDGLVAFGVKAANKRVF